MKGGATPQRTKSRRLFKTTHCLNVVFLAENETLDAVFLGLRMSSSCISLSMLKVPNKDFKQIATAGADTAAGSKFPPKMRHCVCMSVASSRSVKSDYVCWDVVP